MSNPQILWQGSFFSLKVEKNCHKDLKLIAKLSIMKLVVSTTLSRVLIHMRTTAYLNTHLNKEAIFHDQTFG